MSKEVSSQRELLVMPFTNGQMPRLRSTLLLIYGLFIIIFFLADNNVFKESQTLSKQKAKNLVQADLGTIRLLM